MVDIASKLSCDLGYDVGVGRVSSVRVDTAYIVVKDKISEFFNAFGNLVGRHPVWFSLVPLFLSLGLGFGIFRLRVNNDTEELFTPTTSNLFEIRQRVKDLFPDTTSWNFDGFGLVEQPISAIFVIRSGGVDTSTTDTFIVADINRDQDKYNLFRAGVPEQLRLLVKRIKAINVTMDGVTYFFDDLCARHLGVCVENGEQFVSEQFVRAVEAGHVNYPIFEDRFGHTDISSNLVGIRTEASVLKAARVIKIRFFFRLDKIEIATKWLTKFQDFMAEVAKEEFPYDLQIAYSTSQSSKEELMKGITGDIIFFTLTIILMIVYSILVSTGGDVVSTRSLLACGGVLATALGIISSLGLLCLLGVDFVGFVGIMPFLVLGVGVDDMFLLMSSWGESIAHEGTVPQRVGLTFSKAGIGITITSLTDFLAFLIGISSSFIAVRQFCIYTAMAILFCYLVNITLFGACLTLHGDRVYAAKHCITCQPTRSRHYYRTKGSNFCKVYCCGGSVPTKEFEDESVCEKLPRFLLPRIILNPICKVLILLGLCGVLATAVYGAIKLEPGIKYVDLVLRSSYYYKYISWDEAYFGQPLIIAYIVDGEINYGSQEGDVFRRVLNRAQRDPSMDPDFLRCWLHEYSRSLLYPEDPANTTLFMQNLIVFLDNLKIFYNDVQFGPNNASITASRCYVLTTNEVSIFKQSQMMLRIRKLTEDVSEFKMFVYHPVFFILEHTATILPSTLSTVGTAVALMFVVTLAMLPQVLMVCLVTLNIVFIITCVYGSMYYLEITFSGISMIHVLMSVGFSVDFSAHICAAYLMSEDPRRQERARYALVHASGPIFNGGMSSLVGVSMLMLSESYFFRTFFKIMSMVITSGAIGSVFFMPIILSYIGPENIPIISTATLARQRVCEEQPTVFEQLLDPTKGSRKNSLLSADQGTLQAGPAPVPATDQQTEDANPTVQEGNADQKQTIQQQEGNADQKQNVQQPEGNANQNQSVQQPEGNADQKQSVQQPEGNANQNQSVQQPEGKANQNQSVQQPEGKANQNQSEVDALTTDGLAGCAGESDPKTQGLQMVNRAGRSEPAVSRPAPQRLPRAAGLHPVPTVTSRPLSTKLDRVCPLPNWS